ncbi:hypothetical protein [Thermorudis peleae]|uniref:hypothetical protein n=1 Tax=Thermorudis peleae TaxID=1382356 RepID=UPI00056F4927|nr:hypothetical protein [Thermorudis peleae]
MQNLPTRITGPERHDVRRLPGVIDTLGAGYALLNRRPYVVLVLVALDVLYWLGPQLLPTGFTDALANWLTHVGAGSDTLNAIRDLGAHLNLLTLLSIILPSLIASLTPDELAHAGTPLTHIALSRWAAPLAALGLAVLGVFIGMAYYTILGRLVRGHPTLSRGLFRATLQNGLAMIGVGITLIAAALVFFVPISLTAGLGVMIGAGPVILPLIALVLTGLWLWIFLLTFFVEEAIVLSQSGPLRSLALSAAIVRQHFWPVVRFVVAATLIEMGVPIALRVFFRTPWGVPFALLSYAYLMTGVIIAAMVFYLDRVALILRARPEQQGQ